MLAIEFYCVLTLLFILAIPPTSALTADTGEIETITRNLCNLSRFTGSEEEATEYISEKMRERGLAVTVESFDRNPWRR